MSSSRRTTRRVVRRLRYEEDGSTIDVTTVITPNRPTRTPPSIPGVVETPPSPAPVLARFPVSERFVQTISRAAGLVHEDHPLNNAAEALTAIAALPSVRRQSIFVMGSVSTGMASRGPHRLIPRKPIVYDTFTFDETNKIEDIEKCPICLEEYEEGDKCGVLPCKHNFHDACLRQWTNVNSSCPLCRLHLG